jgi:hypothetical protein
MKQTDNGRILTGMERNTKGKDYGTEQKGLD